VMIAAGTRFGPHEIVALVGSGLLTPDWSDNRTSSYWKHFSGKRVNQDLFAHRPVLTMNSCPPVQSG
jgi:hypothetical protein